MEKQKNGSSLEIDKDTTVKLIINTESEFVQKKLEKEIEVKVIETDAPTIEINDENELELIPGEMANDEVGKIYYSIDGGEFTQYTDKIKLGSGTHLVKAYQVSSDKNIRSEEIEKEVTIEETADENFDDSESDSENNITEDNNKTDKKNDNNEAMSNDNKSKENKIQEQKKSKDIMPKTGDSITFFATTILIIIILNIIVKKDRKNGKRSKRK